jgi:hypothetical protein
MYHPCETFTLLSTQTEHLEWFIETKRDDRDQRMQLHWAAAAQLHERLLTLTTAVGPQNASIEEEVPEDSFQLHDQLPSPTTAIVAQNASIEEEGPGNALQLREQLPSLTTAIVA